MLTVPISVLFTKHPKTIYGRPHFFNFIRFIQFIEFVVWSLTTTRY